MAESVIEEAINRRAAALEEVRKWEDFIKMYEALSGSGTTHASQATQSSRRKLEIPREYSHTTSAPKGALAKTEQAVIEILTKSGSPIKTGELLRLLLGRGIEVGGQSPAATLSARLSRADSLINNRSSGWWFRNSTDGNRVGETVPSVEGSDLVNNQVEPRAEGREAGPGGGT